MNRITRTLGRLVKSLTPEQAFNRGLPIVGLSGGSSGVSGAYEQSPVAYACIKRIATDAGNAPFKLLSDPEDPESELPETHPDSMLFKSPNPWFTTNQFMEYIYLLTGLRGEFFITFDNPDNPKQMLQFYDPLYWREMITEDMRLVGFGFNHRSVTFELMPSDLIHHKTNSVSNPFRGQSPLQAATTSLWTSIYGDRLSSNLMGQGGEQGIVYMSEEKLTTTQEEQLTSSLRARRKTGGQVSGDVLLAGGMTILDPKFTGFDYQLFDIVGPSEQKIVSVYGLSPSLIGRDDEPNYATFQGRLKIYWRQTLLPMMTAVESTMDKFFEPRGVYFRYDRANIQGLQEDMKELSQIALILNRGGVPWTVINERLKLGLDVDNIPGADDVMVQGSMVPLSLVIEEAENPPEPQPEPVLPAPEEEEEEEEKFTLPDYQTAKRRAKDIRSLVARNRKLAGLERAVASGWRKQGGKYKSQAVAEMEKAIRENLGIEGAVAQFNNEFGPVMIPADGDYNKDSWELIQPRHVAAAGVGETSIEEITKRLTVDEIKHFAKVPEEFLTDLTLSAIRARQNLIVGMGPNMFQRLMAALFEIVTDEGEVNELTRMVRHQFNVSINRATTIARTEIGTAFNVGRFSNMVDQGYDYHEWATNIDEATRDLHAEADGEAVKHGDLFPFVELRYPQDPAGSAEEVINCRCLTLPMTKEQYDERFSS